MGRKSTIDRLPVEVRDLIGRLFEKQRTLDEILAKLQELDVDVSRSALGRHARKLSKLGERVRRNRAVAEALVSKFGEGEESRQLRLNVELIHSAITDIFDAKDDAEDNEGEPQDGAVLSPMEAHFLAKALDHLSKASAKDAELITKLREQIGKETKDKAGRAVDNVAKERGLTPSVVESLKRAIIGEIDAKPEVAA
ncbi:MAG: DUF3486 family protein [Alphaproteobacteria bacterium]|nr:DUF3486 family protein [Alphaproteobacteria bacterium]